MSDHELTTKSDSRLMKIERNENGKIKAELSEAGLANLINAGMEVAKNKWDAKAREREAEWAARESAYSRKMDALEESERASIALDAAAIKTYNHQLDNAYDYFANQVDLSRPETVDAFLKFSDDAMEKMNDIYENNRKSDKVRVENMEKKSSLFGRLFGKDS